MYMYKYVYLYNKVERLYVHLTASLCTYYAKFHGKDYELHKIYFPVRLVGFKEGKLLR